MKKTQRSKLVLLRLFRSVVQQKIYQQVLAARRPIAVTLMLCGLSLVATGLAVDQGSSASLSEAPVGQKSMDVQHDLSPPLRDMVAQPQDPADLLPHQTENEEGEQRGVPPALAPKAPAKPITTSNLTPQGPVFCPATIVQNFPGMTASPGNTFATDASGAVGPNHFVAAVNFSAAIYDKSGNLLMGPFPTAQFWNGFSGGPCGGGWSDVVVLYDRAADRWFVSRFAARNTPASPAPFTDWYQCFAISQTPDPTGPYYRYAFAIDFNEFNDYPKFGIWPDAYYMTSDRNKIFPGLGNFVCAFDRNNMLTGQPAGSVVFKLNNNGHRAGMLPADWDGHTPPPAGSPDYFIKTLDPNEGWPSYAIQIWTLQVNWTTSTFTLSLATTLTPDPFNSALCGDSQNCIPQPSTSQGLDSLTGGRPSFRLAYRNFGNHETLTFAQTVDLGDESPVHAGIRWYELRKTGGVWSIFQQSTFAPDADNRWIGSLAMDEGGNMAMGYNVSGSVYPSLRVGGRLASDAPGSMSEQFTLQAGSGAQTGSVFWGDYSQTTLDPADDCTFWHVGSFQPVTSNQESWATEIGAFRFCDCRADLGVTKSVSPIGSVAAGTNASYTITLTNNGPRTAGNVTLSDNVPAETGFVSITAPNDWDCATPAVGGSGPVTCTKQSVASGEVATFTIVAKVKCSVANGTTVKNTASAIATTPPDDNSANDSASASFTVSNPVPVVTASVAISQLKQNNHELVNVGLAASVTDGPCPTSPLVVQVFSNEDDQPSNGDDQFSPDAKDIGVGTLSLRQERVGSGDGRVYLIVVQATDTAGGTGFATVTVVVPHDSSGSSIASINSQAAAAKNYADTHNGAPPPGYFIVGDGPVNGPKQSPAAMKSAKTLRGGKRH
jgi:uncharacterized repeat protein (TIGR01451 family)